MASRVRLRPAQVQGDVAPGFGRVADVFHEQLTRGRAIGAACAVVRNGEVVVDLWGGQRDGDRGLPWERDTLVPVFSTTKGMASMVIAVAHSRGHLDLDAPVAAYWDEFAQNGKQDITVRQLLSHQAGLAALDAPIGEGLLADPDALAPVLARQAPLWEPGSRQGYHASPSASTRASCSVGWIRPAHDRVGVRRGRRGPARHRVPHRPARPRRRVPAREVPRRAPRPRAPPPRCCAAPAAAGVLQPPEPHHAGLQGRCRSHDTRNTSTTVACCGTSSRRSVGSATPAGSPAPTGTWPPVVGGWDCTRRPWQRWRRRSCHHRAAAATSCSTATCPSPSATAARSPASRSARTDAATRWPGPAGRSAWPTPPSGSASPTPPTAWASGAPPTRGRSRSAMRSTGAWEGPHRTRALARTRVGLVGAPTEQQLREALASR
jgi:hypothetical protein